MIPIAFQFAATALACYALWRLYTVTARIHPFARLVAAAGLLARIVPGQILFWISYLNLPVAESMQLGDGYWFFGLDGRGFMHSALHYLAQSGGEAVLFIPKSTSAFFHVQVLALCIVLFGAAASISVLFNAAAYLASAIIVARWSTSGAIMTNGGKIALLGLSLSPTWILWATQPLKESFFIFAVVAFMAALRMIGKSMKDRFTREVVVRVTASILLLCGSLYAVASMRWYFGFMLWCVGALALLMFTVHSKIPKWRWVPVALIVFVASAETLVAGGGPFIPDSIRRIFQLSTAVPAMVAARSSVRDELDKARQTQEAYRGPTTFTPTDANDEPDQNDVSRVSVPAGAGARTLIGSGDFNGDGTADVLWRHDQTGEVSVWIRDGDHVAAANVLSTVLLDDTRVIGIGDLDGNGREDIVWHNRKRGRYVAWLMDGSSIMEARRMDSPPRLPAPFAGAQRREARAWALELERAAIRSSRAEDPEPREFPRHSRVTRLALGLLVLLVPVSILTAVGILDLSGGRGLWWFAELDTLAFDAMLVVTMVLALRQLRGGLRGHVLFWPVVFLLLVSAVAIAYVSTNYGTLIRHRGLVFLSLCLLALVSGQSERGDAEPARAD